MTSEPRQNPARTNHRAAPRDRRIVHRLSQMTLETDLPADLQHIPSPRLEARRESGLARYWRFMTTTPPPLPVPRSIMEPGDPGWTRLVLEQNAENRDEILLDLYQLSPQDRIQVRDSMRYTILGEGQRRDATPEQMKAYARRVILQLGDILAAGGCLLRAEIHMVDHPQVFHACRFFLEEAPSPEAAREQYRNAAPGVETRRVRNGEEILSAMPTPEARRAVEDLNEGNADTNLRVYQEDRSFWRIALKPERLWSEAWALRDADDVMDDHMRTPGEKTEC